jgi:hypothetical protein
MTLCVGLQAIGMLTLEPERLKKRSTTTDENHQRWNRAFTERRSSCLRFHFVGVEVLSFLPHS